MLRPGRLKKDRTVGGPNLRTFLNDVNYITPNLCIYTGGGRDMNDPDVQAAVGWG